MVVAYVDYCKVALQHLVDMMEAQLVIGYVFYLMAFSFGQFEPFEGPLQADLS